MFKVLEKTHAPIESLFNPEEAELIFSFLQTSVYQIKKRNSELSNNNFSSENDLKEIEVNHYISELMVQIAAKLEIHLKIKDMTDSQVLEKLASVKKDLKCK